MRNRGFFDWVAGSLHTRHFPFTLLTSNPDRLTRRADEVDANLDYLGQRNGTWMTLSCQDDDLDFDGWYSVSDVRATVKRQLLVLKCRWCGHTQCC